MTEGGKNPYEWKISTSGPPWIVIDWAGNRITYDTREDAIAHVERDKKMFARASADVMKDFQGNIVRAITEGLRQAAVGSERESSEDENS